MQTNSITPEYWRRPDSNTIAYWKLNSQTTTSDATWNHNLTLNWSVSYASDYVNLPWSSSWYFTTSPFISASWSFTISLFCNFDNVSTQRQPIIQQFNDSTNNSAIAIWWSQNKRFIWWKWQWDWTLNSPTITAWQRYNATLVYTPWTLKFYINATLVWTYSRTINTTSPNFFWIWKWRETSSPAYFKWKVWNIVVENTAQWETRISNFFNKLKSKYWIS